jgi:hypothetical protein
MRIRFRTFARVGRRPALLAVGGALLLAVTACDAASRFAIRSASPNGTGPPGVITWDAFDYAYAAPDTLPAGVVTIRMTNRGEEPHHGQLLRLNDGVSFDQFVAALQQEGEGALRLTTPEGGPALIDPARTDEVTLDLAPGSYVLACFVPSPDGVPHLAKGMIKPLEVRASDRSAAAAPEADGTFTMRDFSFDMPTTLPTGKSTYQVVNEGPQPHEFVVVKVAAGKTSEDVRTWYRTPDAPPPFEAVGGINGLADGRAGFTTVDLGPGAYAAICVIPDQASGVPHIELGMIQDFSVQ